jgi:hypothetical protein
MDDAVSAHGDSISEEVSGSGPHPVRTGNPRAASANRTG